jgi:hypothetical protein
MWSIDSNRKRFSSGYRITDFHHAGGGSVLLRFQATRQGAQLSPSLASWNF